MPGKKSKSGGGKGAKSKTKVSKGKMAKKSKNKGTKSKVSKGPKNKNSKMANKRGSKNKPAKKSKGNKKVPPKNKPGAGAASDEGSDDVDFEELGETSPDGTSKPAKSSNENHSEKLQPSAAEIEDELDDEDGDENQEPSQNPDRIRSGEKNKHQSPDNEDDKKDNEKELGSLKCSACSTTDEVRIVLRQCGHVTCVPCALNYLKMKILVEGSARIKCPKETCKLRLHENDVNALLDEKEPALDDYMPREHRIFLQYKHNKHSTFCAIPQIIKRCPFCKSLYTHEEGCNYVRCANKACRTNFCWPCGNPIGLPVSHYTYASSCRLGYKDLEKSLYPLRMLIEVHIVALVIGFPAAVLFCYLYIPMLVFVAVPYSLMRQAWLDATERTDLLTPAEKAILLFKLTMKLLTGLLIAMPISLGSLISSLFLLSLYSSILIVKMSPYGNSRRKYERVLCVVRWVGRLFRIGPYGELLKEAEKNREELHKRFDQCNDSSERGKITDLESGSSSNGKKASSAKAENDYVVRIGDKKN
ncbi:unnamed protein product [Caenorhabditis auriculariae]|uniref:RING-type domain-containing protein n=1 Tax=Caenorhabditis auriculariae TaxID=2777116 RepID=A0A8S1HVX5_9PELO|nr:unnamed protein product [Caenorhabditis auriculariae]